MGRGREAEGAGASTGGGHFCSLKSFLLVGCKTSLASGGILLNRPYISQKAHGSLPWFGNTAERGAGSRVCIHHVIVSGSTYKRVVQPPVTSFV